MTVLTAHAGPDFLKPTDSIGIFHGSWIMRAVRGEELTRLAQEHASGLLLYARQWSASPEDVVQEAFLRLASQARMPRNPVPWLYRVVRNGAFAHTRAATRRRRHELAAARGSAWLDATERNGPDVEAATEALRAVPAEQREVVIARLWGGLAFYEIGKLVNCSAATAHRRYAAGLATLRERLGLH